VELLLYIDVMLSIDLHQCIFIYYIVYKNLNKVSVKFLFNLKTLPLYDYLVAAPLSS
jgi:hypothetical protein